VQHGSQRQTADAAADDQDSSTRPNAPYPFLATLAAALRHVVGSRASGVADALRSTLLTIARFLWKSFPPSRILGFQRPEEGDVRRVSITVNGDDHALELEPRELLVYVLRERLGLTGTNVGCDTSSCGACTVLMDGESVKACTLLGVQADGHEITTIEGLATSGSFHPVQEAFHQEHALQCGYCTPGFVMATVSLLREMPHPTEEQIRRSLEGNLCRCTGYHNIVRAVKAAAGVGEF
jgi:carbon-monoxide dehydrogenase small subunit